MIRRTLGQIKSEIARTIGTSGMNASDGRVISRINEATEELMAYEDWPGVVDRYLFQVNNGNIILPYFLERIMGVAINNIPYEMKSPWFEFVEYGPGPQSGCNWVDSVIDRDETPIQVAFPCGTSLSLYTVAQLDEDVNGVRPTLLVQGRLQNQREVRSFSGTSWISGEELDINGVTPPYTFAGTAQFFDITGVVKPETNGYVELWGTDGINNTMLAAFAPEETNPSYHAYFLPRLTECGCCCPGTNGTKTFTVLVRARKRFIAVANDDDPLIISNLPALKMMTMAIQKREVSDPEGYGQYKAGAIDIMRKEAASYRGKIRTPAIQFTRGSSFGAFTVLR